MTYMSLGVFSIQPIGAVPKGATIIYFRLGLNTDFISSADGISLKATGKVSLLSRGIVLAQFSKLIKDRKITALPYSEFLYKFSLD